MRFIVKPNKENWGKLTVIDTNTNEDLRYRVVGWENETVISWCDALNRKYRQK